MRSIIISWTMSIIHVMFTWFTPQAYLILYMAVRSWMISNHFKPKHKQISISEEGHIISGKQTEWLWQYYGLRTFIATVNGCGPRSNDPQEINGEETNLDASDATPMEAEGGRPGSAKTLVLNLKQLRTSQRDIGIMWCSCQQCMKTRSHTHRYIYIIIYI